MELEISIQTTFFSDEYVHDFCLWSMYMQFYPFPLSALDTHSSGSKVTLKNIYNNTPPSNMV